MYVRGQRVFETGVINLRFLFLSVWIIQIGCGKRFIR